jgi:hypothetical protein
MPTDIASIRAKLNEADLAFLKQAYGLELRDPEAVLALSAIDDARNRVLAVQERALRKFRERDGRMPHCSFCDGSTHAVGPLAQSSFGPLICKACALASVAAIEATCDEV